MTGVNRLNAGVPCKVSLIQRENVAYAMSQHSGDQARIVYLNTLHTVSNNQLPPDGIHLVVVREQNHLSFDVFDRFICFDNGEPKSISIHGSRANVPELSDILRRETQFDIERFQFSERSSDELMLWIGLAGEP